MLKNLLAYVFVLSVTWVSAQDNTDSIPVSSGLINKAINSSKDTAQTSASDTNVESVVIVKKEKKVKNPVKASLLSAVLPGAGQIYNGKWWKAPIVVGGFATAYVMHDFYYGKYQFYHQILIYKNDGVDASIIESYADANNKDYTAYSGAELATFDQSVIKIHNDLAEKRTQQIYLATSLFYILQIVDASVDAHFSNYDISDDLSVKFKPSLVPMNYAYTPGLGIKFSF